MNSEEFVDAVKIVVRDASVSGSLNSLIRPAGRKPDRKLVELSTWFNELSDSDKEMIEKVIKYVADISVFSFFSVLDGATVIESGPDKGDLELYYIKGTEKLLLNEPSNPLHDIFNAE
ncbi:hypothetical protein A1507_11370 [Methylomonas koyamae]|uniref:Uncharacterized protein n=1 Tax=Methylomonas koyamae TaxID=702114 RepID=A0A177NHN2_9GAMM|nr:hypothetical protein [Methylomonas koyamae]OAI16963.1 hypothetical protein A1507_11370 [Methylomonas koyamae]